MNEEDPIIICSMCTACVLSVAATAELRFISVSEGTTAEKQIWRLFLPSSCAESKILSNTQELYQENRTPHVEYAWEPFWRASVDMQNYRTNTD